MKYDHGIRSLRGYQSGDPVEDSPGPGASRTLSSYGDVSKRRQQKWDEENRLMNRVDQRLSPMFIKQWARDIAGAQIRDRLGFIPGAERLGNWVGAPDITAEDLTRDEYQALRETALRAMTQPGRQRNANEWKIDYPDYGFSVTDPEHLTNRAFEAMFGGYDIDYDHPSWATEGVGGSSIRGDQEAIDELVGHSGGWSTVAKPGSRPATMAAGGKGPTILNSDLYKSARGLAGLIPRMTDPSANLQQMIGRTQILRDPDTGDYYAQDRYNWNKGFHAQHGRNFNPFSREDWGLLKESWGEGEDLYDKARVLSEYFGSKSADTGDPQGSFVRINMGPLDDYYLDEADRLATRETPDLEEEESMFARLMDWSRGLGDRDETDETQVAGVPPNILDAIPEAPPPLPSVRQARGLPDRPSDISLSDLERFEFPR